MDKELRNRIFENKILTHNERAKIISDLESYEDLKDKIDKAIEEITECRDNGFVAYEVLAFNKALKILKRNIGE